MNTPKKLIIAGVAFMVVSGTAVVSAVTGNTQEPDTQTVTSQKPIDQNDNSDITVQSDPVDTAPVSVQATVQAGGTNLGNTPQVAAVQPSQEDINRNRLQVVVNAKASELGLTGSVYEAQWICIDRYVSNGMGYSNYDSLVSTDSPAYSFLNQTPDAKFYFDGAGSCRVLNR